MLQLSNTANCTETLLQPQSISHSRPGNLRNHAISCAAVLHQRSFYKYLAKPKANYTIDQVKLVNTIPAKYITISHLVNYN